jgi:hypothetical protein
MQNAHLNIMKVSLGMRAPLDLEQVVLELAMIDRVVTDKRR